MPGEGADILDEISSGIRPLGRIVSFEFLDTILFLVFLGKLQFFFTLRLLPRHKFQCHGGSVGSDACVKLLEAASNATSYLLVFGFVVAEGFLKKLVIGAVLEVRELVVLERRLVGLPGIEVDGFGCEGWIGSGVRWEAKERR
jgi:hypothetical protein